MQTEVSTWLPDRVVDGTRSLGLGLLFFQTPTATPYCDGFIRHYIRHRNAGTVDQSHSWHFISALDPHLLRWLKVCTQRPDNNCSHLIKILVPSFSVCSLGCAYKSFPEASSPPGGFVTQPTSLNLLSSPVFTTNNTACGLKKQTSFLHLLSI